MKAANPCPCHVCKPVAPRAEWGMNARGGWRLPSTYFPQYAEERWQRRREREEERKARLESEAART